MNVQSTFNEDEIRVIELALTLYEEDVKQMLQRKECQDDEAHYALKTANSVKEKIGIND